MRELIEALCSDDCAGRAAGSAGGRAARALLTDALRSAGVTPEEQAVAGCGGTNLLASVEAEPAAGRWVLVGAHYDHLGQRGSSVYRGADDNAAACAMVVELARSLARRPPQGRNVLLALFDGEEPPHFLTEDMGSAQFCRTPTVPLDRVDLMVCLDLVGHAVGPPTLPAEVRQTLFALGAERSEGTAAIIDALARATEGVVVRRADVEMVPPLSDYVHFWRRKVPFVFLTCGRWAHYHAVSDEPSRLDYEKIAASGRWLEQLTRAACARPGGRVRFTGEPDDASTLRSLGELLGAMGASPASSTAGAQLQALLARCDEHGRLREADRAQAQQLVALIERTLAA